MSLIERVLENAKERREKILSGKVNFCTSVVVAVLGGVGETGSRVICNDDLAINHLYLFRYAVDNIWVVIHGIKGVGAPCASTEVFRGG